ncbi:DinB family protein [Pedobacter endophyticus]|uniref:DinB family protein n=1 Tax=Pedobacter endophyticus TaxID=2789740 RepID=A0A7S9PZ39_9SPHI|nr:DinB family protein [Pedobacter endophyticus]QPH39530.1 DinB family protein [Pedobacter endophyticus]
MKTQPNSTKMYGIVVLYQMQTDFFLRALDGIDQKDAQNRLNTQANHIAWITGSVVSGRFYLAKLLGIDVQSETGDLFENNAGIIADATYPSLANFKKDWEKISAPLEVALTQVSDDKLNENVEMPGMQITLFDMISFTSYREANCIGQIALWRRLLGYQGMKYM